MKSMSVKLCLILCFAVITATGQTIKGTVLDATTDKPLENVTVYFQKARTGTVTDDRGTYLLKLPLKIHPDDTLRFSIVGYAAHSYTLRVLKEQMFVVRLSKKIENLNEVTIASHKVLQPKLGYKKLVSLKNGVYHSGSVLIGHKIYVTGGDASSVDDAAKRALDHNYTGSFSEFLKKSNMSFEYEGYNGRIQIYDIDNNTWTVSPVKVEKRAYHKLIFLHHKLYILGGKTLSANKRFEYLADNIEVLDTLTNKIITDHINPHQAVDFAAVTFHNNIIVMGGSVKRENTGEKVYTDQAHIYNTATGYWYALPQMTHPKEVNGVIFGHQIYLVGGFNKIPLKEIESYDLSTGKWHKAGDLFYSAAYPALAVHNNTIYIFNDDKMQTYNVKSGVLKEYAIDLELQGSQMHCYKNKLYIVGGYVYDDYMKSPASGVYCIPLDEFSNTKVLHSVQLH